MHFLPINPLQQLRSRLIIRVLGNKLAAHREVENGLAELLNMFRAGGEAWKLLEIESGAFLECAEDNGLHAFITVVQSMQGRRHK